MKHILMLTVLVALFGCGGPRDEAQHETPSQGSMTIYCDDQVMPLMRTEVAAYDSIYPNVHLTLVSISAREAVVKLLSGESKLIVIGRRLADDEKALVTKYNIPYGEYEIAKDALAVIVNRSNPIDTLSVGTIKSIFDGSVSTWKKIRTDVPRPIKTVVPAPGSSSYLTFIAQVMKSDIKSAGAVTDSAQQMLEIVRHDEGAIGVLDWNQVSRDTTVRVIRVAGVDSTGAATPYTLLHPAYIHLKKYPLLHSVYGYTTEGHPALAKGFMAYVCNAEGQRIALDQGLVPATQIIRLREPE